MFFLLNCRAVSHHDSLQRVFDIINQTRSCFPITSFLLNALVLHIVFCLKIYCASGYFSTSVPSGSHVSARQLSMSFHAHSYASLAVALIFSCFGAGAYFSLPPPSWFARPEDLSVSAAPLMFWHAPLRLLFMVATLCQRIHTRCSFGAPPPSPQYSSCPVLRMIALCFPSSTPVCPHSLAHTRSPHPLPCTPTLCLLPPMILPTHSLVSLLHVHCPPADLSTGTQLLLLLLSMLTLACDKNWCWIQ